MTSDPAPGSRASRAGQPEREHPARLDIGVIGAGRVGTALAVADLVAGQVTMVFGDPVSVLPHMRSGTLRALAVSSPQRSSIMPDVPTLMESGYPDLEAVAWHGLMAPAKTPPEIVARIEKETLAILRRPEMLSKLEQSGFDVTAKSGKEHMERVTKEVAMFRDIIEKAGIQKLQ